ncbi:MAG TPA: glycosyltransferase family 2 protein [Candidatus Saccharimonadales bacterium]|nr:glycosyltransferase family 2 protein [Candidatus Saccharimonadales bacterium]
MKFDQVSVVMITKNEEASVKKVINDIKKDAPGAEIIIVDSSNDDTPKLGQEAGANVIRQIPPQGYGPAIERALMTPTRDIIVTLDCDDTYPTNYIPKLVKLINDGYDVVGTSRISGKKPKHMATLNYLSNKFINIFASIIFFRKVLDGHTGMRAYRRSVLHGIKWWMKGKSLPFLPMFTFGSKGNAIPVELLLKPMSLGYKCIEIPIPYKQRIGETKLEKINSFIWTFIRIFTSRFSSKSFIFGFILFSLLAVLTLNNFLHYDPSWGYDGQYHLRYIDYVSKNFRIPTEIFYTSNPPLYYFVAGVILKIFPSLKAVQFLSILFYSLEVGFLLFLLNRLYKNRYLTYTITFFFAMLPITLNFGYMVFNYSLSFFFSLSILTILVSLIKKQAINFKWVLLLSLLTSLGILTALNNLAILLVVIFFLLFFPYAKFLSKLKFLLLTVVVTLVVVGPYYNFMIANYKCFFCTTNRIKTTLTFDKVYPPEFYNKIDLTVLDNPISPNHLKDAGLWLMLHQTLFGDYFDYLVDARTQHFTKGNTTGLLNTGWNFISVRKVLKLKAMEFTALPIALMLIATLFLNLKDGFLFLFFNRKEKFLNFIIALTSFGVFFQFLLYILNYPDYVNIHAGYLFPAIFLLLISVPQYFKHKYIFPIVIYNLLAFSLLSYYTFIFRG